MVSYLVILLVALAFLLVCRVFFYKPAPRRRVPYVPQASRRRHAHEKVVPERLQVHSEPAWSSSTVDTTVVQSAAAPAVAKAGQETRELPRLSPTAVSEPERDELAQTQIVNRENLKELVESSTEPEPALATANAVREKSRCGNSRRSLKLPIHWKTRSRYCAGRYGIFWCGMRLSARIWRTMWNG